MWAGRRPRHPAAQSPSVLARRTAHSHAVSRAFPLLGALALLAAASCRIERAPSGRPGGGYAVETDSAVSAAVYAAVRDYYAALTAHDTARLAGIFLPGAVVADLASATGDTASRARAFGVEAYVARSVRGSARDVSDEPVHASIVSYGGLADAWVTYRVRVRVAGESTVTRFGIDAFHFLLVEGRWRIAGLATQAEVAGQPIASGPARR
jgi:hypothetical protein